MRDGANMYKLAFLIPHYNHSEKIELLVQILAKFNYEILIIDDGSDENHKQILRRLNAQILYRDKNGGKGAALKDGFKFLLKNGFTHAFQIDADMQHDLLNLNDFIKLSKDNQNALICGSPEYDKSAPRSRFYGRKITNFWVAINTLSLKIKDAMCGFRIYPLKKTCELLNKCKSDRMEFDIDIIYTLFKNGVKILWLKTAVNYQKDNTSHFKMWRDNLDISKIHAKHFLNLPFYIFKRLKGV